MDLVKDYYGKSMIADTDVGDGNVLFEKEYLEFRPRSYELKDRAFRIYYKDILDVKGYKGIKSTVAVTIAKGDVKFYMYKMNTFIQQVESGRKYWNVVDAEVVDSVKEETKKEPLTNEQIDKLTKLADLHKNGVLSDEQYEEEKNLILNR